MIGGSKLLAAGAGAVALVAGSLLAAPAAEAHFHHPFGFYGPWFAPRVFFAPPPPPPLAPPPAPIVVVPRVAFVPPPPPVYGYGYYGYRYRYRHAVYHHHHHRAVHNVARHWCSCNCCK